jgi:hypothetical protein
MGRKHLTLTEVVVFGGTIGVLAFLVVAGWIAGGFL